MCPSWKRLPWIETGILHIGVIMGNDRKTDFTRRNSFVGLDGPFRLPGCWREMLCFGEGGVPVDNGEDTLGDERLVGCIRRGSGFE